jgi:hypothetical protein
MSRCAQAIWSLLAVGLVSLAMTGAAAAFGSDGPSALTGEWNRLSVDQSNPAPEHELLRCVENNGAQAGDSGDTWFCRYSKRPEATLNFYWNNTQGFLSGRDITATWSCPTWFASSICSNVVQVIEGTMTFTQPGKDFSFSVLEDLVVTHSGANEVLYVYWVGLFYCPWFRTFEEAVAANPLPLPFDGTWPPQDCVGAL